MANVKINDDSITVTLEVEEFLKGGITPRETARQGGSVVAYFVLDKLRSLPQYAKEVDKYSAVVTTLLKGKLVVTFKDIDSNDPNGL